MRNSFAAKTDRAVMRCCFCGQGLYFRMAAKSLEIISAKTSVAVCEVPHFGK
jgi:hypothetical protein